MREYIMKVDRWKNVDCQQDFYEEYKRVYGIAYEIKKQQNSQEQLIYQLANRIVNL